MILLIIEIAVGVFLGLLVFGMFWAWLADRRIERQLENQLQGLTTDQLRMLQDIRDPGNHAGRWQYAYRQRCQPEPASKPAARLMGTDPPAK
jgi:hypothetical protein